MADDGQGPVVERAEEVEISNEFAYVRVAKVWTRNGERLEISSPRLSRTIRLDPIELESLTWQTTETFTKFIETPFGTER